MWRLGLLLIGFFAIPVSVQAVWAQAGAAGQGQIQSVSYREVPERLALSLVLYDNSDLDLEIRDRMQAALESVKHRVEPAALFELELVHEFSTSTYREREPSLGEMHSKGNDVELNMNVWSTTQDSILGGRQEQEHRSSESRFVVRAVLREKSGGDVVWDGQAVVKCDREQAGRYVPPMVAALARSLGQTVRHGSFVAP